MKRIKMGIIALAAITGIGGAFAFSPKTHRAGTTYYGYLDGTGNARWSTVQPGNDCQEDAKALACTITSTSPQATVTGLSNQFPAQYTIVNGADLIHK